MVHSEGEKDIFFWQWLADTKNVDRFLRKYQSTIHEAENYLTLIESA